MSARVLVVDDNRDMADGIAMLLSELAFEVEVANSARDGLELLERGEFAVVLSDIRMPGMDGTELLAEIRRRWPRTRVVLLTAFGSIDSAVGAMKEGASDYLTKPFDNAQLVEVVQKNVALSTATSSFDIASIVATVAALLSPDDLFGSLAEALEALRSAAGADDCELFLSEPDGKDALLSVWVGPDAQALVDRMRFEPNVGYPGIVLATGEPLSTQGGLADDPRYLRRAVLERGIQSYACAALTEPRGTFGSIHLLSRRAEFPVDSAVTLLQRAAVPIASAVRAGLAALRQTVDATSSPHEPGSAAQLRALLECICKKAGSTAGTISLIDPESGRPVSPLSIGPSSLLCAHAEAGTWSDCPSVLGGHGFAGEGGRRAWPVACRRGMPRRVVSPCCLPLRAAGKFHGIVVLDLGARGDGLAVCQLVPLLVMAQQVALHLAARHPGYKPKEGADVEVADSPAPELELLCLGPFAIRQRGIPVAAERFARSKALSLLKMLALKAGTPLSKDYLIEQLWPDTDPVAGANRLHGVVHALRSVIEPHRTDRCWIYVKNRGELYYLDLDAPIEIDVRRYRALVARGMRLADGHPAEAEAALEQAVALYRGALFEDDPYAEYCEVERRELLERQLGALERLATLCTAQGSEERALEHLRAAVRLAPYREDLMVRLLELLVRIGRVAEARAQFDELRQLLEREIGCAPSPALDALRKRIFSPQDLRPRT